jgi:hypothetical protein
VAFLYGRTGRLTAKNGDFRPGQWGMYRFAVTKVDLQSESIASLKVGLGGRSIASEIEPPNLSVNLV